MEKRVFILLVFVFAFPLASAGVGISYIENISVLEDTKTCFSYGIYNPWPEESKIRIELSENLENILKLHSSFEVIPGGIPSEESIPLEFCLDIPKVYEEDCLIDSVICKQECQGEVKRYVGEIEVIEVGSLEDEGSETTLSVSASLNVEVRCVPHKRNYSFVYLVIVIACVVLLFNKKRFNLNTGASKNLKDERS